MINDQQGPGPIPNGSRVRKDQQENERKKDASPATSSQKTLTSWQLVGVAVVVVAVVTVREPRAMQPGK